VGYFEKVAHSRSSLVFWQANLKEGESAFPPHFILKLLISTLSEKTVGTCRVSVSRISLLTIN
jgi:hypothetical protein